MAAIFLVGVAVVAFSAFFVNLAAKNPKTGAGELDIAAWQLAQGQVELLKIWDDADWQARLPLSQTGTAALRCQLNGQKKDTAPATANSNRCTVNGVTYTVDTVAQRVSAGNRTIRVTVTVTWPVAPSSNPVQLTAFYWH
ncbi:MAG: hypothetical protein N3A57_05135 [Negativicutes bacterium]|nr:hypothetical protein [Negativicutes bacterium]